MHGPAVVTWLLAALAAGSGGYCLRRLRHARPTCAPGLAPAPRAGHKPDRHRPDRHKPDRHRPDRHADDREPDDREPDDRARQREVDTAEAVMALGMGGMALLPGVLWGWLYAVLAGGLLLGAVGPGSAGLRVHRLHHGVGALAMTYMALAMATSPAHLHHAAPPGLPLLTGLLLLYFGGYTLWESSRLLATPTGHAVPPARLTQACRAAMGIGMFAMLLTM